MFIDVTGMIGKNSRGVREGELVFGSAKGVLVGLPVEAEVGTAASIEERSTLTIFSLSLVWR